MGLREQAAADLRAIIADTGGFSACCELTSHDGITVETRGLVADVSQLIDPQTGQAVSGRVVSVALPLAELVDWPGLAAGTAELTAKPWVVRFQDVAGVEGTWKVRETRPDRELGVLVCLLERYQP